MEGKKKKLPLDVSLFSILIKSMTERRKRKSDREKFNRRCSCSSSNQMTVVYACATFEKRWKLLFSLIKGKASHSLWPLWNFSNRFLLLLFWELKKQFKCQVLQKGEKQTGLRMLPQNKCFRNIIWMYVCIMYSIDSSRKWDCPATGGRTSRKVCFSMLCQWMRMVRVEHEGGNRFRDFLFR